jgi:hypothetical protein
VISFTAQPLGTYLRRLDWPRDVVEKIFFSSTRNLVKHSCGRAYSFDVEIAKE